MNAIFSYQISLVIQSRFEVSDENPRIQLVLKHSYLSYIINHNWNYLTLQIEHPYGKTRPAEREHDDNNAQES